MCIFGVTLATIQSYITLISTHILGRCRSAASKKTPAKQSAQKKSPSHKGKSGGAKKPVVTGVLQTTRTGPVDLQYQYDSFWTSTWLHNTYTLTLLYQCSKYHSSASHLMLQIPTPHIQSLITSWMHDLLQQLTCRRTDDAYANSPSAEELAKMNIFARLMLDIPNMNASGWWVSGTQFMPSVYVCAYCCTASTVRPSIWLARN